MNKQRKKQVKKPSLTKKQGHQRSQFRQQQEEQQKLLLEKQHQKPGTKKLVVSIDDNVRTNGINFVGDDGEVVNAWILSLSVCGGWTSIIIKTRAQCKKCGGVSTQFNLRFLKPTHQFSCWNCNAGPGIIHLRELNNRVKIDYSRSTGTTSTGSYERSHETTVAKAKLVGPFDFYGHPCIDCSWYAVITAASGDSEVRAEKEEDGDDLMIDGEVVGKWVEVESR